VTGLSFDLTEEQEQLHAGPAADGGADLLHRQHGGGRLRLRRRPGRPAERIDDDGWWPMSGTKIQKARLRQRIADELAAASVTQAPRLTLPSAQA
jgi:hypothetical protein